MTRAARIVLLAAVAAAFGTGRGSPQAAGKEKPDITSRNGLRVGSVSISWGNPAPVDLKAADSIQAGPQACAFNATYDMSNLGGVATSPAFTNRLRVDGTTVLAVNSGLTLGPYEVHSITTAPYLPVGEHTIELSLDDDNTVAESNENNNRFKATYRLKAPCGTAPTPPAAGTGRRA
jgi:hypothetical protein